MSKFNKTNTNKTTNRSGYVAYKMSDKEHLVTAVLSTMFGEQKFYRSTDSDIVQLATKCAKSEPEFLCKLACYARNIANLRSVSHVLTCIIAREAHEFTRVTIRNVVVRPDDITEIMSCYLSMYGKPFPNAMKREISVVVQNFDEYQLAKYNGGNKTIKFRDVLRITHPVPISAEKETLLGKILNDTLDTPYTWETELSAKGNKKEVWDELIKSKKVGYMALLRNLRNIVTSGADYTEVLKIIANAEQVKKSRQFPFRFFSAYKTLLKSGLMNGEIHKALENAITCSLDNMEKIPGRTLVAVDVSSSMHMKISAKSDIQCLDIAALFAAISNRICEDATICYFDRAESWYSSRGSKGYKIEHYGKFDSILSIALNSPFNGGGTDLSLPMIFALEEDDTRQLKPFDRVIYFSDCVCTSNANGLVKTTQGLADKYRATYNKNFWVHGVDLQGYGTQQFCGDKFNLIAGWDEAVLSFINLAEKGIATLVTTIDNYDIGK